MLQGPSSSSARAPVQAELFQLIKIIFRGRAALQSPYEGEQISLSRTSLSVSSPGNEETSAHLIRRARVGDTFHFFNEACGIFALALTY